MPHKKKLFTKDNSVKFLLRPGNVNAVNADGKHLENILIPCPKSYKPGTSLIFHNLPDMCNLVPPEEPDLKRMLDDFDDEDSEVIENLPTELKQLNLSENSKFKSVYDDFEVDGQFSDVSDDSFQSDEDVANLVDPNCPEALKILNEKFEQVIKEYNDDQIGPLDDEDICGYLSTSSKRVTDLLEAQDHPIEEEIVLGDCDEDLKHKILNYAEDSGDEKIVQIVMEKPITFDCESMLSTYSNKYNHPAVIKEEKIKKIEISNNPLKKKLTKSQLKTLDNEKESDSESDDNLSVSTAFNIRTKEETPEERRQRKNLFKEAKRESRILKKENKLAFKKEKKLQKSQTLNAQRNAGIKLL